MLYVLDLKKNLVSISTFVDGKEHIWKKNFKEALTIGFRVDTLPGWRKSIGAIEDKGFKVAFVDGKIRIWKRNFKEDLTIGFRVDTLYPIGGSPLGAISFDTTLQTELWHEGLHTFITNPFPKQGRW